MLWVLNMSLVLKVWNRKQKFNEKDIYDIGMYVSLKYPGGLSNSACSSYLFCSLSYHIFVKNQLSSKLMVCSEPHMTLEFYVNVSIWIPKN